MNKLDQLRNDINKVMEENKPKIVYNQPWDKAIRECELELTNLEVKISFDVNLNVLTKNVDNPLLCQGKFKESEYSLQWNTDKEGNYRLILKNIPYNNPKVLITLPDNYKEYVSNFLTQFLDLFIKSFHSDK